MSTEDQQAWIAKFTGGKGIAPELLATLSLDAQCEVRRLVEKQEELVLRDALIRRANQQVDEITATLKAAFRDTKVETTSGKMRIIGKGGDQASGFGFLHDMSKVKKTPENQQKMTNAMGSVIDIRKGLQKVFVRRSRVQGDAIVLVEEELFQARDIEEELYTPLVRSLLYPEELVANEFSATQRMIDNSNQLYIDELVARSEVPNRGAEAESWGNALKAVSGAVKDLASVAVDLAPGSGSVEQVKAHANTVKLIMTVSDAVLQTGVSLTVEIVKSDACNGVSCVLNGLSGAVGGLVKHFTGDENLAKFVATGMKGGSRLPKLVGALIKPGTVEEKGGNFIDVMGDLWGDVFDLGAVGKNDKESAQIGKVKVAIVTLYKGSAAAYKGNIIRCIEREDWGGVTKVFTSIAGEVVKGALVGVSQDQILAKKQAIDEDKDGKLLGQTKKDYPGLEGEELKKQFQKTLDAAKQGIDDTFGAIATRQEVGSDGVVSVAGNIVDFVDAKQLKKRQDGWQRQAEVDSQSLGREAQKDVDARLEAEEEEFGRTLDLLGKDQLSEADLKNVGKLIAKVQRDKLIMQVAFAVGNGGFAVAAQFFQPMAIAGTITKFIEQLTMAIQRAIELRRWVESSTQALNAVSPYLTSIQNFVKNQAEQFSHHTIKAALIAVQAAAQIAGTVSSGTYGQAVALVVEKGAKLAETIEELTYKIYKKADLEHAWTITKPALENPDNRKANLIARKLNPTLAKYTLAYGAVIERNVVAMEAASKIGLDRETLSARDAKVDKVVEYMELRYDEDNKIYKQFTGKLEWVKKAPKPELTARCWLSVHALAVREGNVVEDKPDAITRRFFELQEAQGTFTSAAQRAMAARAENDPEALVAPLQGMKSYEDAVTNLRGLLQGYHPTMTENRGTSEDLVGVVSLFVDLLDAEHATIEFARAEAQRAA